MNKESPFSVEYSISNSTESKPLANQDVAPKNEDENYFIEKIKSDYKLSKPRRKLIRAKIIIP